MRKISDWFHVEGEEIIKTSNGQAIPREEPLFLLRGRDHLAVEHLRAYRRLCVLDGCNEYILDSIDEAIERFKAYAATYPERMKQPGITRGR